MPRRRAAGKGIVAALLLLSGSPALACDGVRCHHLVACIGQGRHFAGMALAGPASPVQGHLYPGGARCVGLWRDSAANGFADIAIACDGGPKIAFRLSREMLAHGSGVAAASDGSIAHVYLARPEELDAAGDAASLCRALPHH
jgi:hypothetical protein